MFVSNTQNFIIIYTLYNLNRNDTDNMLKRFRLQQLVLISSVNSSVYKRVKTQEIINQILSNLKKKLHLSTLTN